MAVLIYWERDEFLCGKSDAGKSCQANIQHSCSVQDLTIDALSTVYFLKYPMHVIFILIINKINNTYGTKYQINTSEVLFENELTMQVGSFQRTLKM